MMATSQVRMKISFPERKNFDVFEKDRLRRIQPNGSR
jgi:hypothetical protein